MSDKRSLQDQVDGQSTRHTSKTARIATVLALVVGAVALVIGGFVLGVVRGADILKVIDPQLAQQVEPQPQIVTEQLDDGYDGTLARRVSAAAADVRAGAIDTPSASAATEGALDGFMRSVGDGAAYLDQDEYESYERSFGAQRTVVATRLEDEVGIIALSAFSQSSAEQVSQAIDELVAQGATSFILDLRGNAGGDLEQGRSVASLFLNGGIFAIERTSDGNQRLEADASLHKTDAPLAVLVSSDTEQTAEIVAGALQDHGRALVVGDATAGDGTVATIRTLSFGGALRYTVGYCSTPDAHEIEGVGITPDIAVSMDKRLRDALLAQTEHGDASADADARSRSAAASAASLSARGSMSQEGDEASSSQAASSLLSDQETSSQDASDASDQGEQASSRSGDVQLKAALDAVRGQSGEQSNNAQADSPSSNPTDPESEQ